MGAKRGMAVFREAFFSAPTPPCESREETGARCSGFRRCAEEGLACVAFLHYVRQTSVPVKIRMRVGAAYRPTRAVFKLIYGEQDDE